eukprot:gnl/TRDRNA2_/TRDRNA2_150292_c0_seq2.p1 gnl/TRDRNA2_/TRDRNA2_150292_c0~~gnl/TRDRNA2_/TRDRNA2_150292_c0_seq2.p1  ORF type:complete len:257 (+),score=39.53 gnl/TRDRNA2_/TRDRNA2_150292_c0_seq2:84-773(+)
MGAQGKERFLAALAQNTTLTSLDLPFVFLMAQGAGRLAAALEQNNSMVSLDLNCCLIRCEGAERLAAALVQNDTLTSLNLHCNCIESNGARRLVAALETNTTVSTLDFASNSIGPKCERRLAAALKRNAAGILVLTAWFSRQGSEHYKAACADLGGAVVAVVHVEAQSTVASLKGTIASQLTHTGHLRLVLPDGTLLNDPDKLISELFHGTADQAPSPKRRKLEILMPS